MDIHISDALRPRIVITGGTIVRFRIQLKFLLLSDSAETLQGQCITISYNNINNNKYYYSLINTIKCLDNQLLS